MKKIDKNIIYLGWVSFFTDMASAMVTTLLPVFVVYVLNEGVDKLGFIIAIATFISYALRIVFGYLSDKYQIVKPFVVTGYLISAVTKPLLMFSNSFTSVALFRTLERTGKAVRSASKDSLISKYSQKNQAGKTFGFHKMMDISGEVFGALIVFFMFYVYGTSEEIFKTIFLLTVIPGVLAVIFTFFIEDVKSNKKYSFDFLKDKTVAIEIMLMSLILVFVVSESFFIVKAKESINLLYIPLFVILMNLAQTIFSYPFGVLIDKYGEKFYYYVVIFHIIAVIFLYLNFLTGAFIFEGLFLVGFFNYMRIYISNHAYNKATVFGIFYFLFALFGGLGSIITGYLWKNFGFVWVLNFTILGIFITFVIWRNYAKVNY